MPKIRKRYFVMGGVLAVLVAANLLIHWPQNGSAELPHFGGAGMPDEVPASLRQNLQAGLQNLPEAQRGAVEKRLEEDRAFLASVKDLPAPQRQQKLREHFAENPPPPIPGLPGGGPADPPPGGGPESGRLPSPEMRRSLDQQIVNALKGANQP